MSSAESSSVPNGRNENVGGSQGVSAAALYLLNNKKEGFMWVSRLATMLFTLFYLLPFLTGNPYSYYYKALMANAVTSMIRLSQRLPRVEFSKAFLSQLLQEDSCHYVFYSLIFMYTHPTTLVLLPMFLFALLHSTSFTLKLLMVLGCSNSPLSPGNTLYDMTKFVERRSGGILQLVAFTEIFLMPLTVFTLFLAKGSILTPIIYYRFLTLRYMSKRNPYTRTVFSQMRLSIEQWACQPAVPMWMRRLCHKLVALVSRLAPPMATA